MSIEAINDFFKSFDSNQNLTDEFEKLTPGDDYKQQVVELAKKYNFEFTLEELNDVIAAAKRLKDGAQ